MAERLVAPPVGFGQYRKEWFRHGGSQAKKVTV